MARRSSRIITGIEDRVFAPRPEAEPALAAPQGPPSAVINGTFRDDTLVGTESDDTISGLGGHDILRGLGADDTLNGGDGNDRMDGGSGSDLMTGGRGNDVYVVGATGDQTVEVAGQGVDTVEAWINWTLSDNVENLTLLGGAVTGYGNAEANVLTGGDGTNYLYGRDGNDTINGGLGADILYGEGGNDRLDGGAGDDVMNGGAGDDVFVVGSSSDQTHEASGEGTDRVEAWVNHALWANVENLTLYGSAQFGSGNTLNNVIVGNALDNWLYGGGAMTRSTAGRAPTGYMAATETMSWPAAPAPTGCSGGMGRTRSPTPACGPTIQSACSWMGPIASPSSPAPTTATSSRTSSSPGSATRPCLYRRRSSARPRPTPWTERPERM